MGGEGRSALSKTGVSVFIVTAGESMLHNQVDALAAPAVTGRSDVHTKGVLSTTQSGVGLSCLVCGVRDTSFDTNMLVQ